MTVDGAVRPFDPPVMPRSPGWLPTLLGLCLGALLSVTCGPPGPPGGDCRFDPHCPGGVGAYCDNDGECGSGHCCDKKECDGGMCTFECDDDHECPQGLLCEHGVCFYACSTAADCASGQKCKHDGVCEWD